MSEHTKVITYKCDRCGKTMEPEDKAYTMTYLDDILIDVESAVGTKSFVLRPYVRLDGGLQESGAPSFTPDYCKKCAIELLKKTIEMIENPNIESKEIHWSNDKKNIMKYDPDGSQLHQIDNREKSSNAISGCRCFRDG